MANVTAAVTLTSTDLLTDSFSAAVTKTITATATTGLARRPVAATAAGSSAVILYTADDFAAIAYIYIKNTDATASDYIWVYDDTSSGDPVVLKLAGGDWAFMPLNADKTLKAYAPNGSNPVIEWMVFGADQ